MGPGAGGPQIPTEHRACRLCSDQDPDSYCHRGQGRCPARGGRWLVVPAAAAYDAAQSKCWPSRVSGKILRQMVTKKKQMPLLQAVHAAERGWQLCHSLSKQQQPMPSFGGAARPVPPPTAPRRPAAFRDRSPPSAEAEEGVPRPGTAAHRPAEAGSAAGSGRAAVPTADRGRTGRCFCCSSVLSCEEHSLHLRYLETCRN